MRALPGIYAKLVRDRLDLMTSATATYGDAVRVVMGPKVLYIFNHPDHAKHVLADNSAGYHKGMGLAQARRVLGDGLLTSEGELWREQRAAIQPLFGNRRIAGQAGVVAQQAAELVDRLKACQGGPPVDLARELTAFTLGVFGRTLLDADLSTFTTIGHAFEAVQDQAMFEMVSLSLLPLWLPLRRHQRFKAARRQLGQIADSLAAGRPAIDGLAAGQNPSRQRLREELITLLLAGHETTASTLSWALYLISAHPEVAERLRAEAIEVLGNRLPSYEDLPALTYTTRVISETMRLYPPVWALTRQAQADDRVGGYHVPAGADVLICPYTLHRHPAFWAEPSRFDPDRFTEARSAGRPRYAYIPFGAGPRFCVGNNLGLLEATFVLTLLARELRLVTVPGYQVVAEPMLSLRIRGGLPMTVERVPA
jgi:cytochrome P450